MADTPDEFLARLKAKEPKTPTEKEAARRAEFAKQLRCEANEDARYDELSDLLEGHPPGDINRPRMNKPDLRSVPLTEAADPHLPEDTDTHKPTLRLVPHS